MIRECRASNLPRLACCSDAPINLSMEGAMVKILEVIRKGSKNCRVRLEDGRSCLVPMDKAVEGAFLDPSYIRETSRSLVYQESFLPKSVNNQEARKATPVYPDKPFEEILQYSTENEISLIKACIYKNVVRRSLPIHQRDFDDLAVSIFLHFWEKKFYHRYDSERLNYHTFISVGVRNYLLDLVKSSSFKANGYCLSLNKAISTDGAAEFQDLLIDERASFEEDYLKKARLDSLLSDIREALSHQDSGLPEVSFVSLFDALLRGENLKTFSKKTPYHPSTLSKRKVFLVKFLRENFTEDYREVLA